MFREAHEENATPSPPPTPRKRLRTGARGLLAFMIAAIVLGLCFVLNTVYESRRDRPSALWPTTTGTIFACATDYHSGRHHYYFVSLTYTYKVNDVRHVSHRICLWNPDLAGDYADAAGFVAAHPVHSTAPVYYDPDSPDVGVLIPGADEQGHNIGMICGTIMMVAGIFGAFRVGQAYSRARRRPEYSRPDLPPQPAPTPDPAQVATDSNPDATAAAGVSYLSYEPADRRKLGAFPDRDCLDDFLGHDGEKVQDWKPDDRVIDSAGRVYRLARRHGHRSYDLEATGETWDYHRALELALGDFRLLKRDPKPLLRRVESAPEPERLAVIIKFVDALPSGPRWFFVALALFLILFFLAVMLVTGWVMAWLRRL